MANPRVVEEGTGKTNSFVLERIRFYKIKDQQDGTTHQVWKYRRGPNDYEYEVIKM